MLFNPGGDPACFCKCSAEEFNGFRPGQIRERREPTARSQKMKRIPMTFLSCRFLPALFLMTALFVLGAAAQEPEDRKPHKPHSIAVATGHTHVPAEDALSR